MGILNWIRRIRPPWRSWSVQTTVARMTDVAVRLRRCRAVLVGTAENPKWLVFDCPCAQPHRVMVPLNRRTWPAWPVLAAVPLSLTPSVDERRGNKRCHYVIRSGRVHWVR